MKKKKKLKRKQVIKDADFTCLEFSFSLFNNLARPKKKYHKKKLPDEINQLIVLMNEENILF